MKFFKKLAFALIFFSASVLHAQDVRQAKWQQTVNYQIDVTLDDVNHMLRGFETFEYINNSPNMIDVLYIHVWPNAYRNNQTAFARQQMQNREADFYFAEEIDRGYIDSLDFFVNGKGTTWNFDVKHIDIVKITLNKPLESGEACKVSTPFLVKIPKVFSRLGHDGQTYNITQWYPKPAVYDINGWNPMPYLNQGEFYSEFGSFDVTITLPKNYIIAATGELLTPDEELFRKAKGKKTELMENTFCKTPFKSVRFKQNNVHDFAWFASKNFGMISSSVQIGDKTVETFVYSQKEKDLIDENMQAIKTALTYYSENAGNYPYQHATVVKSELKAGGGMEYPMITVCDILNKEVIIHEVGHNWFYGILGSNERRYPWMDESINSYFEGQAMKPTTDTVTINKRQSFFNNINDYSMELMAINSTRSNTDQAVGLHSDQYTGINYGTMVYGKGSIIFKHLRAYLGDEVFKKCFTNYFEIWKYKHPLPGDMEDVFEYVSGKNLDWFFNTLVQTDNTIDFKFKSVKNTADGNTTIALKSKSTGMPVPLGIYTKDGLKETVWVDNKTITIPALSKDVTKFVIDPDKLVFDANRKNNQYKTHGLLKKWSNPGFKFLSRPDLNPNRDMYWMPILGYNMHNGFMIGAALHNWGLPQRKLEYIIAPLWGFKSKSPSGYANFTYKITPNKVFQSIDIGLLNASFAYKPYSETFNYYRSKGFVNFTLKPNQMRSSKSNQILLSYTNVASRWLSQSNNLPDSSWVVLQRAPIDYSFGRLSFIHANKRVLDPYSLKLNLEAGSYENLYLKPSVELNFTKSYNKRKKGFRMRMFAGTFYAQTYKNGQSGNGLFKYRLGSKNGQFDYGMDHTLVGRNAKTGLWSSAITPGEDNLKLKGALGNFSKPFVTLNLDSDLPGKLPIRPYVDLCYTKEDFLKDKNGKVENLVYSGGIAFMILPDVFEVYFPLFQSKSINDIQNLQGIKTFGQKICFTLILNEFEPHRFLKRIKLF